MVEPIKHTFTSAAATAGIETAKGAVEGALFIPAVLAVGAAVVVGIGAAFVASPLAAVGLALAAGVGVGGAALVGEGALAYFFAPVAAVVAGISAIGGLLGLAKGGKKITKETEAADAMIERHNQHHMTRDTIVANQALQQGYLMGAQEGRQRGQQEVVQALQQQMEAAQAAEAQKKPGFSDKIKKQEGHVATVESKANDTGAPQRG